MHDQGDETVVDVDLATLLDDVDNVRVVDVQDILVAVLGVLVVDRDLDLLALDELNLSSGTL